ncbi:hypothetical protein H6802_02300 [Candidatus Nomurabacteria bacterium]|uniref:YbaB/EbfC family DNA-binding protein n=1 Tax=candidate division WWE3 bacterium TaxID=2053526 RepID=A0A955E0H0_UNCKA|nr:hypothetical protein [candidate division WWE3 bacterium]MCB9823764.1 hypothetical protein [Candidatus Nomurabacteria bacterium]MCB9826830.1 hypothetical protein [Candidatus Nomurabacteria bacterium]MCB9827559.1 hypothetical protein [Candidatus Nomurabacteria bacterium]HXK52949.1 hypothetical protein [bacterium]
MIDKLKAVNKARKLQSDIKSQLEQIFHQEEKGNNSVLVRGDKRIEKIVIDGEERSDIKAMLNDALKQIDKKSEKKMKDQAGDLMALLGL